MNKGNLSTESTNTSEFRIHGDIELLSGAFTTRSFSPHFHERYSLILVEEGAGDYSYKKNDYIVTGGRLLILNPYDVHTGRSIAQEEWKFRSMYLPVELMETQSQVEGKNENLSWKDRIIDQPQLIGQFTSLHDRLMREQSNIETESLLTQFICDLRQASYEPLKVDILHEDHPLNRIRDFLHDNFSAEVNLADLEKISGWSKFHLIHRFTKRFGLSPHKYLLNLRIAAAKRLLRQDYSATDVAYQTGFFDQSHFIRTFKAMTGITPKAYG